MAQYISSESISFNEVNVIGDNNFGVEPSRPFIVSQALLAEHHLNLAAAHSQALAVEHHFLSRDINGENGSMKLEQGFSCRITHSHNTLPPICLLLYALKEEPGVPSTATFLKHWEESLSIV